MRGTIISQSEHRMEFRDLNETSHILYRTETGFWLGENGRLYVLRTPGGDRRAEEKELFCLGRSFGLRPSFDSHQEHAARPKNPRSVKDRMAGDYLRVLYKEQELTLAEIAERYDASVVYICNLLREYDIAARPPGRKPEEPGFEKPKEYQWRVSLQRITQALLDYPARSDRRIAADLDSDHRTVAKVRQELEKGGHIPVMDKVLGQDGKWYTVKREETRKEEENV